MSGTPADKRQPRQKTFQDRLRGVETLQTLKLYKYMLKNSEKYCFYFNSRKRYVVVLCHSQIFAECKKDVSYRCISGELIQIATEQLRKKRIIIYFPYFIVTFLLLGAILKTDLVNK